VSKNCSHWQNQNTNAKYQTRCITLLGASGRGDIRFARTAKWLHVILQRLIQPIRYLQHLTLLTRKQSKSTHLRQGHVVRQVAAPYSVCSGFPYAPLKAMLTKISKWFRIQDSFRITTKTESLVVFAIPDTPRKFQKDLSITFWVILLTHRQTDRQTNKQTNKQSLAKT